LLLTGLEVAPDEKKPFFDDVREVVVSGFARGQIRTGSFWEISLTIPRSGKNAG